METINRKEAARDFIYGDNLPYFDEAWDILEKRCPKALERGTTNHPKKIEKEEIFGKPIDKVINLLQSLKDEGYETISEQYDSFDGISHMEANKMLPETDYEYGKRVGKQVRREIGYIKMRKDEREREQMEIEELEKRLNELKRELSK